MQKIEVIIIGGGQAGLAMGYYLSQSGINYIIIEKGVVAQSWRDRYDSLQLITPKEYSNLPGLTFPDNAGDFPEKAEVIRYLETYADMIKAPVKENCTVLKVRKGLNGNFLVETTGGNFEADQVVVASGYLQKPSIPPFSRNINKQVFQIHSNDYRNASDLPKGVTLVVGAGNTGISIARELAADRKVYLAQGKTKRLPRRLLGRDIFWWAEKFGLFRLNTTSGPGRKLAKKMIGSGDATYGLYPETLAKQNNVELTERIVEANDHAIVSKDNKQLTDVEVVVWATGFKPDYNRWIEFGIFDDKGIPFHDRGVTQMPGLYFLGLKWQYTISSFLLHGVGQDAEHLAAHIKKFREKEKTGQVKQYQKDKLQTYSSSG